MTNIERQILKNHLRLLYNQYFQERTPIANETLKEIRATEALLAEQQSPPCGAFQSVTTTNEFQFCQYLLSRGYCYVARDYESCDIWVYRDKPSLVDDAFEYSGDSLAIRPELAAFKWLAEGHLYDIAANTIQKGEQSYEY